MLRARRPIQSPSAVDQSTRPRKGSRLLRHGGGSASRLSVRIVVRAIVRGVPRVWAASLARVQKLVECEFLGGKLATSGKQL